MASIFIDLPRTHTESGFSSDSPTDPFMTADCHPLGHIRHEWTDTHAVLVH